MPCNSFFFFNISGQIACCRDTDYIFISMLFSIYTLCKTQSRNKEEDGDGKKKMRIIMGKNEKNFSRNKFIISFLPDISQVPIRKTNQNLLNDFANV